MAQLQTGDENPLSERRVNIEHRDDATLRYSVPETMLSYYTRQGYRATTWEDDNSPYETPAKRARHEEEEAAQTAAEVVAEAEQEGEKLSNKEIAERVEEARKE